MLVIVPPLLVILLLDVLLIMPLFVNVFPISICNLVPTQLYVTNFETKQTNIYYSYQVFELLKNECLDAEPLHCYFDRMNGVTKEHRIRVIEKWEKSYNQFEERQKMEQEDKNIKIRK